VLEMSIVTTYISGCTPHVKPNHWNFILIIAAF
jgi:hypothetical protein